VRKLALVLALAVTLSMQAAPFERSRFAINNQSFVLDNGLTVIVHEDHDVPIVAVNVWYHVGSRNERRGKTGFAHLFEHFFFNGSTNYPHGFREAMDDLGATNRNGTTDSDRTNFFENVPTSALERTLYLEADRMGFLAGNISQEMLERERGVVQNEKRQGENQPYGRAFDRISETIYPYSHPYSWSTIGSMEDLNAASLDDIKQWYATYYGPNNAVLTLAGDITVARAKELVTKYFSGIAPGPALARMNEWIPKLDRDIRDEMQDRVPQTRIYRVWHAPAWRDAKPVQHLQLLSDILSGSKTSRLDRQLVYQKELATSVSAFMAASELASNFIILATVKPGVDPGTVEKEIDAIVGELLEKGPTAEELQRVQTGELADFTRGTETLGGFGGRSEILAESQTFGGKPDAYLDRLELIAKATPAEVQATAKRWLSEHHYTLRINPYPSLAPGKTDVDRKVLPALAVAPNVTFPAVQRATLSNGLKVILLERHGTPIVNAVLAADAGFASDPAPRAGLAGLALDVIDKGTITRDAFQLTNELESLGAVLSAFNTLDQSVLHLNALPQNLGASLDLFADIAMHPAFPQDMVDLSIRQRVARIRQEQANPTSVGARILPRLLYGADHAYAKPFTGSGYEKTIAPLKRADLVEWHRTWFLPNNSVMIIAGDTKLSDVVPQLERAFGSWKKGTLPTKNLTNVAPGTGRKVYLIDKPDAPQSVIYAAHLSEPGGVPDDIAIDTVLRNFGGIATSRLNRNLRLDKHWSYGVRGGLADARGQRPFIITAPVQTDKTKESIVELKKEIEGVAGARPIAGEEYASVMRNQSLSLPGRFATLQSLENAALNIVNYGFPDDYYANFAASVRALTEKDLDEAGRKAVRPAEVVWVIVGDLKKVEPGIRELNLGEVIHYDGEM
jgi:zinc protease